MQMVSRTYTIRHIEPVDREKNAWSIARAEEREDLDEVEIIKRHFAEWEKGARSDPRATCVCRMRRQLANAYGQRHVAAARSAGRGATELG
jgi:hypothetical protein